MLLLAARLPPRVIKAEAIKIDSKGAVAGLCRDGLESTPGVTQQPDSSETGALRHTNKKNRQVAMFTQPKVRQASLIVFATMLILIVPNLTSLVS